MGCTKHEQRVSSALAHIHIHVAISTSAISLLSSAVIAQDLECTSYDVVAREMQSINNTPDGSMYKAGNILSEVCAQAADKCSDPTVAACLRRWSEGLKCASRKLKEGGEVDCDESVLSNNDCPMACPAAGIAAIVPSVSGHPPPQKSTSLAPTAVAQLQRPAHAAKPTAQAPTWTTQQQRPTQQRVSAAVGNILAQSNAPAASVSDPSLHQ